MGKVVLALLLVVACHFSLTSATSMSAMLRCFANRFGWSDINRDVICAATKMFQNYNQMRNVQCRNCDKYFHCRGNYEAVYMCGNSVSARRAAEIISDCREFSQGGMDADGMADDAANRHGRNGGSCAQAYLCNVNCKYNPGNRSCRASNC